METTSTPAGEQPPASIDTPDAGAQPQAVDHQATIDGLIQNDPTALLAMLDGHPKPAPTVAAATAAAPDSGAEPEPIPAEPIPEAKHATRIRLTGLSEADQKLTIDARALVAEGKASSIYEAMRSLAGETPPSSQTASQIQADPTTPEPVAESPATASDLETKLATLRAERKEAKLSFDGETESDLTNQIEDILLEIQVARSSEQVAQVESRNYVTNYRSAAAEVEETYAEAFDTNPHFEKALDALKAKAEAENDPRTNNPRYIVDLAAEAAEMVGWKQTALQTRRTATLPPTPPARAARPVGSTTAPGHTNQAVLTREQHAMAFDSLSDSERLRLVDSF